MTAISPLAQPYGLFNETFRNGAFKTGFRKEQNFETKK